MNVTLTIPFEELAWFSDWGGEEVGYDDILIVGLYGWIGKNVDMYIDMDTMQILEIWSVEEEE